MTETLKPCPFCGGQPEAWNHRVTENRMAHCRDTECAGHYALATVAAWNRRASDWQPIETAPRETDVLLHYPGRPITVAALFRGEWLSFDSGDEPVSAGLPTHWQPLPEPPEGQP